MSTSVMQECKDPFANLKNKPYSFKAGKVNLNESTGEATPLRGQGVVVVDRSREDSSLLGIQWKPRSTYLRDTTDELMILPGDVEFNHVKECQTGRVISMKFISSGKKTLFWLQEPSKGDLNEFSEEDQHVLDTLITLSSRSIDESDEEGDEEEQMKDE